MCSIIRSGGKNRMKRFRSPVFCIGLVLTLIGVVMFLSNVRVGDFSFTHFSRNNIGPLLLVLWCIVLTLLIIRQSLLFELLLGAVTLALIVVIILNVHIYVVSTPMIKFLAMLALIFGGAGLMIRDIF